MVLSVQAAIGKEHRHEGTYICVKFGYVINHESAILSAYNKSIPSQKDRFKIKSAEIMCCLDSQWPDFN